MNVRGIFPSLGAGGSLIAAVLCAAAVVGGGLAFRDEPGSSAEANAGDVVVPGRTARAQTSSPGLVRTVVALTETGQEARRAERLRRAATRQRARAPRRGATLTPAAPTPRPSTPSAPAPSGGSGGRGSSSAPKPSSPVPVPSTPAPPVPSGTVERVVEQTRSAAQPVVDAVPPPAKAPVQDVVDTVEHVAGTVDQTVDGVTGTLLP